jgi:hypothetical protein
VVVTMGIPPPAIATIVDVVVVVVEGLVGVQANELDPL